MATFSAAHESRKVLTVAGAISARAKYLLRKIETSRRKTAARKAAKAELFSARLWAIAKNLRRCFRKVAPDHHTLSSFVTRLRERPQHCSRKAVVRATNWKAWIATAGASAHSSTEKISECADELRCCFHKGSASCQTPTCHQKTTTTTRRSSSRRSCRARLNFRASCKARVRPGRASGSIPVF